jgi:predicted Zn-dependent protease
MKTGSRSHSRHPSRSRSSLKVSFGLGTLFLYGFGVVTFSAGCSSTAPVDFSSTDNTLVFLESTHGKIEEPRITSMVHAVSQRLILSQDGVRHFPAARGLEIQRSTSLPWQISVLSQAEVNAFSLGNGVVVVTAGILRTLDSEAKFAAVLAHEMSHEILGHTHAAQTEGAETQILQHYDTEKEIAADKFSVLLLHSAGYDPKASIEALTAVTSLQTDPVTSPLFQQRGCWRCRTRSQSYRQTAPISSIRDGITGRGIV